MDRFTSCFEPVPFQHSEKRKAFQILYSYNQKLQCVLTCRRTDFTILRSPNRYPQSGSPSSSDDPIACSSSVYISGDVKKENVNTLNFFPFNSMRLLPRNSYKLVVATTSDGRILSLHKRNPTFSAYPRHLNGLSDVVAVQ